MSQDSTKSFKDHVEAIAGNGLLNPIAHVILTFMVGYGLFGFGRIEGDNALLFVGIAWLLVSGAAFLFWMFRPLTVLGTMVTFLMFGAVSLVSIVSLVWVATITESSSAAMIVGGILLAWQTMQIGSDVALVWLGFQDRNSVRA